jgi:hypothetical protein
MKLEIQRTACLGTVTSGRNICYGPQLYLMHALVGQVSINPLFIIHEPNLFI